MHWPHLPNAGHCALASPSSFHWPFPNTHQCALRPLASLQGTRLTLPVSFSPLALPTSPGACCPCRLSGPDPTSPVCACGSDPTGCPAVQGQGFKGGMSPGCFFLGYKQAPSPGFCCHLTSKHHYCWVSSPGRAMPPPPPYTFIGHTCQRWLLWLTLLCVGYSIGSVFPLS